VARQLFEPALAEVPPSGRGDLFQGPAGVAGRLLGLPGAYPDAPGGQVTAPDAPFAVLHGLYWLCVNLAGERPLVVTVDDAHWADPSSLRFLAFLVARLEELPIALVLATRPEADEATAALLGVLLADPLALTLRPSPLSARAVGRLIEEEVGHAPAPELIAACHRSTGGVPLLVRELVAALGDDDARLTARAGDGADAIGARTIGRTITLRLGRLSAPAGRLARAVAVLETADLVPAADLAGLDPSAAAAAVDELVAAGMLRPGLPLAFAHPIMRASVLEEVPSAERLHAHRRAAELLAANGVSSERVAEHLLATAPAGDPWTVERLTDAARTAARRGAPESAARYLRRVLAEPPAPQARAQILLELGVAEAMAGQPAGEARLREALAAAGDDGVRLGAALVLAHLLGRDERIAQAVEVVDLAAAELTDADGHARVLLESMAMSAGMLDAATAPGLATRLHAMRRAAGDPAAPREVLGVAALVAAHGNEPASTCVALAQRALATGTRIVPEPTDLPWFAQATIGLVWADAHAQAQTALDAGVAESRRIGDPALFALSLSQRAWLLLRRGDLQGAEGDARSVLDAGDLAAPALYRKLAAAMLVAASVEQGALTQGDMVLDAFGVDETKRTHTAATLRLARGLLRLAQQRPAEALTDILAAGDIVVATGSTCPGYLAWRSAAAMAHHALGDGQAARRLAREEVELARAFGGERTLGVALRAAGVVAGGRAGEELVRESIECHERAGARLERARSLAELGTLLCHADRPTEARELLREALDIAHSAGAAPLADRAEAALRTIGAAPRRAVLTGAAALTASERRVAELAADGLTNREIAQALFVTIRTVEGHLTRAFAKLDLRSRQGLAVALQPQR
jgi:DNA-binding CsgD family transcriptional regulator